MPVPNRPPGGPHPDDADAHMSIRVLATANALGVRLHQVIARELCAPRWKPVRQTKAASYHELAWRQLEKATGRVLRGDLAQLGVVLPGQSESRAETVVQPRKKVE